MKNLKWIAIATLAALAASSAAQAQFGGQQNRQNQGQYNNNNYDPRDTYQDGYRAGYEDGRANRRYNDQMPTSRPGNNNRSQLFQRRYSRVYSFNDDRYYRECHAANEPVGVVAGITIGGSRGILMGDETGADLTKDLNCSDRGYYYRTYTQAFNAGRSNSQYEWRNQANGRRGTLRIGSYYNDQDGFRCLTFSQTTYIEANLQRSANGRVCQQPDGAWVVVDISNVR